MIDYYGYLKVKRDASQEEIRRAYRQMAFHYHPDRNPGDITSIRMFKVISDAYETLSDEKKRAAYDKSIQPPPLPVKRPVKKESVELQWGNAGNFKVFDAPKPKRDLWGRSLPQNEPYWRDSSEHLYIDEELPDLR